MKASIAAAVVGGASTALAAAARGFNYASQGQSLDGFTSSFTTAAGLGGAANFNSARLYTMIQEGTTNTPIDAIQAAINTGTTLLLGLWTSVPQETFDNEITALTAAIQQYGSDFADLVVGISVGSEDLYRISATGIENDSGVGQSPDTLVDYISQVRKAIEGTSLSSKPVGHVDTWNVYVNDTNNEVIAACDWLGLDEYPYFQTTDSNSIDNAGFLFFQAYDRVNAVAGGKPIWITESGWPVSGKTSNLAVASVDDAAIYWQTVMCELEHRDINTWWYILEDAGATPSFGLSNNGQPLYDLSCNATSGYHPANTTTSSNSTSTGSSTTATGTNGFATTTSSGSSSTSTDSSSGGSNPGSSGGSGTSGGSGSGSSSGSGGSSTTTGPANASSTGAGSKLENSVLGFGIAIMVAMFAL